MFCDSLLHFLPLESCYSDKAVYKAQSKGVKDVSILSETYIFYADVFFLQNLIIKSTALYLTLLLHREYRCIRTFAGITRILIISALGTLAEVLGLLSAISYHFLSGMIYLIEIPILLLMTMGKKKGKFLRAIMTDCIFVVLINGIIEALWNRFGSEGNYFLMILAACMIVLAGVNVWQYHHQIKKGILSVEIVNGNKKCMVRALYDTGNHLCDPYTGKGVHIISDQVLKKLGCEQFQAVWIPYQALGNESGMLEAYYVEKMTVEVEKGEICLEKCPLGVTKEDLFKGKEYELILNEEVF